MATATVDMSLDDIIQMNRKSGAGGRGRGRGRGASRGGARGGTGSAGALRRFRGSGGVTQRRRMISNRSQPYSRGSIPNKWEHDMYEGGVARSGGGGSGPAKIHISNLDFGVSDNDIKELFSDFGGVKKAAVHYDKSGRSLGTAEVWFTSQNSAVKAMQQYNNVNLDGRPMNIQISTSSVNGLQSSGRLSVGGGRGRGVVRGSRLGGRSRGQAGGFGRGRGGRGGRGRGGSPRKNVTAEQLDKDLDDYASQSTMDMS